MSAFFPGLLLLGCTERAPERPGGVVTVGVATEPTTVMTHFSLTASDHFVSDTMVYNPFFVSLQDGRLKWEPGLIADWQWSADGRSVTQTIRDGVQWSDGVPITAADFAFATEIIAHPDAGSSRQTYLSDLTASGRPEILDDQTMRWTFTTPGHREQRMLHLQALSPMPRHILGSLDPASLRDYRHEVSSSPWKIDRWEAGDRIELVPDPAFSGPPEHTPKLDRVVVRFIPDLTTRLEALAAGTLDVAGPVPWQEAQAVIAENPAIKVVRRPPMSLQFVAWNLVSPDDYARLRAARPDGVPHPRDTAPHPILGDLAVRRALAQAVDIDAILATHYPSPGEGPPLAWPSVGSISPALASHADDITRLPHDPDAAAAALSLAGWVDADGDGIRERDGVPLALDLLVPSASRIRAEIAATLQRALREVGVRLQVHQLPFSDVLARIHDRSFDAALVGYQTDPIANPTIAWHTDSYATFNMAAFSDPEVDRLIQVSNQEADPAVREAALKEMQHRIYAAQPYLFLCWFEEIVLARDRVGGLQPDLALQVGMHGWTVE